MKEDRLSNLIPWEDDLKKNIRSWIATGHDGNEAGCIEDAMEKKTLQAMIIIQDCNAGGQYYRYFWYEPGHEGKRFNTVGGWYLDSSAEIEIGGVQGLVDGDIRTVCKKMKFKIQKRSEFVALLLPHTDEVHTPVANNDESTTATTDPIGTNAVTLTESSTDAVAADTHVATSSTSKSLKPWEEDLSKNLKSWMTFGNSDNLPGNIMEAMSNKTLQAMIIIQDCNSAGQYYRYFWYEPEHPGKRFNCITSKWYLDSSDDVVLGGVVGLSDGDIRIICEKMCFKVKKDNPFVALLLPTDDIPIPAATTSAESNGSYCSVC
jgi:hypothetical protein